MDPTDLFIENAMNQFIAVGKSDVGLKRSNNEDALLVRPDLGFCLVADGMGGAAAGEIASRILSDTAFEIFSNTTASTQEEAVMQIQRAFGLANERIQSHIQQYPQHKGMGCTAELFAFSGPDFVIGHIGDSRTYRLANGTLKQLTKDHSLVQEQVDLGLITPTEARTHSMRNVILRAVGVEEDLALDIVRGKTIQGDLFLLCSDGLTDMISDDIIQEAVLSERPVEDKITHLIDLAKAAGGFDNITVALVEIA
jgi:serine/threonine protein phosphatase PrpC